MSTVLSPDEKKSTKNHLVDKHVTNTNSNSSNIENVLPPSLECMAKQSTSPAQAVTWTGAGPPDLLAKRKSIADITAVTVASGYSDEKRRKSFEVY